MDDEVIKGAIGEQVLAELKAVHELVVDVPTINKRLTTIEADVAEIKADMVAVKSVVRDHSAHLKLHDEQIAELKRAA